MHPVKEEVSPIGGGKDGRFRNQETFGARGEGNQGGSFRDGEWGEVTIEVCSVSACFIT